MKFYTKFYICYIDICYLMDNSIKAKLIQPFKTDFVIEFNNSTHKAKGNLVCFKISWIFSFKIWKHKIFKKPLQ